MSPSPSKKQVSKKGRGSNARPVNRENSMRSATLFLLVGADAIVAVTLLGSLFGFLLRPDPAVKAVPMLVTLFLTTAAALLMTLLAVNATYYPVLSRAQRANLSLVMWTMGATGVVTGLLTLGGAVSSIVMRLMVGSLAYFFIAFQRSRIERMRAAAAAGRSAAPAGRAPAPASKAQASVKSRQRRGGRKT